MSHNLFGGDITNEQASIDISLLPSLVKDMSHGEQGYFVRSAFGADIRDRSKKQKRLWVNGFATLYSENEIEDFVSEVNNDIEFARIVRVKSRNLDGENISGCYVDDSLYEHAEAVPSDERIQYLDPTSSEINSLKVIKYAFDVLSAQRIEAAINHEFTLELGHNALLNYVQLKP